MKSRSAGFSLIELVVSLGISTVVIYTAAYLFEQSFSGVEGSHRRLNIVSDQVLVQGLVTRTLSVSDVQLFGLNGSDVFDQAFTRVMLPRPGVCADLTKGGICENGVSLQYAHFDRKSSKTVIAYCWIEPAKKLLVDVSILGIVSSSLDASPIALINPPAAPIFLVSAMDSVSMTGGVPDVPPECLEHFDKDANDKYIVSNRRVASVSTFRIQNKAALVSEQSQLRMAQKFPVSVGKVNFFSMGLMPNADRPEFADFVVRPCTVSAAQDMSCNEDPLFQITEIKGNRIYSFFQTSFAGDPATLKYQLTGSSFKFEGACVDPACKALPILDEADVPYALNGEGREKLIGSSFSGIKQEFLRKLDMVLVDSEMKEHTFSIPLE